MISGGDADDDGVTRKRTSRGRRRWWSNVRGWWCRRKEVEEGRKEEGWIRGGRRARGNILPCRSNVMMDAERR